MKARKDIVTVQPAREAGSARELEASAPEPERRPESKERGRRSRGGAHAAARTKKRSGGRAPRASRKNARRRRARVLILPGAVIVLLAAALLFLFLRSLRTYKLDSPSFHYDVGVRFPHDKGTVIERTDAEITLTDERAEFPLGPIPVFFEGGRSFVLPDNMTMFLPQEGLYGKAGYFATVTENPGGGGYTLRSGADRSSIPAGFLFDGRNQYIFLERAEIVWGDGEDERITLEPLSYMAVVYNLRIEIYPRGAEQGVLLDTGAARVMAYMSDYSVDLSKDIMYIEGQEMLLFADPDLLDPYKRIINE
ncbi:MAG: hypothetical protein LBK23_10395 [Oscillospiraceae bacterium]|nr:hypothetical protein [Oscillospiraceae bacterium]